MREEREGEEGGRGREMEREERRGGRGRERWRERERVRGKGQIIC